MAIMRYIRKAFRYTAMPGIVPRLKRFDLRFPFIAHLIAQIYSAVRLLPPSHAYLSPANTGTYSVRQVIMAAMDRLREHRAADQIIVFGIITMAIALLLGQFVMLILMLGIDTAQAQVTSLFETPNPDKDIALMMLDLVFGIPETFGSENAPAGPGEINPFQQGLHELFRLYSYAILLLGGLILVYYIFAVVAETAQTGSPFGERFDNIYAPLRLVIAIGLLIPVHYGLNSGQHLTLHLAKWGSGLANNGWSLFNDTLSASSEANASGPVNMLGAGQDALLGKPEVRNIGSLVEFFYLANMCAYHYEHTGLPEAKADTRKGEIEAFVNAVGTGGSFEYVKPYLVRNQAELINDDDSDDDGDGDGDLFDPEGTYKHVDLGLSLNDALQFHNYGDVTIRFGHQDYGMHPGYKGGVKPLCGEATISVNSLNRHGALNIYESYFNMLKLMWHSPHVRKFAIRYYLVQNKSGTQDEHPACDDALQPTIGPGGQGGFNWDNACNKEPQGGYAQEILNSRQALMKAQIESARQDYIDNGAFNVNDAMEERGWGGAAIWFNDIAAANGSFFSAAYNIPSVTSYPYIMQKIVEHRLRTAEDEQSAAAGEIEAFAPSFGKNAPRGDWYARENALADSGYNLLKYFDNGSVNADAKLSTGNAFRDLINMFLGTQGLFSIRDNREVHPLAQIPALGRSMLNTSMRNFAMGAGFAVGSGTAKSERATNNLAGASGSMVGMALMGALLGAILHYVLPFMPFIYFFFAVSNWVKEIFEAMIGVPLWAVAHLQLEGKGLPGSSAGEGYFLLFGIFLRPILILFGLIAAIAVFSAEAIILHDIFDLVIANLSGHGSYTGEDGEFLIEGMTFARATLDEFFYTVLYVIILYLMATASFKLIDAIPESILRWAGSDAKPFSDDQQDATGNLVRNVAIGTRMALQGPLQEATTELGQTGGHAIRGVSDAVGRTAGIAGSAASGGANTIISRLSFGR